MTLACTFIVGLLLQVFHELPVSQLSSFFGFESAVPLAAFVITFNFLVIVVALALLIYQLNVERRNTLQMRLQATAAKPTLALDRDKRWLGFLSHSWANQATAATIKRQLQLLLPGVQIFLGA